MVKVLLRYAGKRKQFADLNNGYYNIGRAPNNSVIVDPRYMDVSRYHCAIRITSDSVNVVDKESPYGTYVNERKLEPGVCNCLSSGDRLKLGRNLSLDVVISNNELRESVGNRFLSLLGLR